MADLIYQRLTELRVPNWEGVMFVPEKDLEALFDRSSISLILDELERHGDIKPYHIEQALEAIQFGGKKVFAILCNMRCGGLVMDFIHHGDEFLKAQLDSKLPYEEQMLQRIIPNQYRTFYDQQWAFSSPVITPNLWHRKLSDKCILPFVSKQQLGSGGFGTVSRVALHHSNQGFKDTGEAPVIVAVKEFVHQPTGGEFSHEQHMLSLLRLLRHANIVQFHTSYTLRNVDYIILEAADYDLYHLFSINRPPALTDEIVFRGMRGIASAITYVHNYFWEERDLKLIGCHYDLKPANILIRDTRFLLSDFGLSRLKSEDQGSASKFKGGFGDYIAPECLQIPDCVQQPIRRASDVWSFGCILTEMLCYLFGGAAGVATFREARKVVMASFFIVYVFHNGNEPNAGVIRLLREMQEASASEAHRNGLICLIRAMITIESLHRPDASMVEAGLTLLSVRLVYDQVRKLLPTVSQSDVFTLIQQTRFNAWAFTTGIENIHGKSSAFWTEQTNVLTQASEVLEILTSLRKDLTIQAENERHVDQSSFLHRRTLQNHIGKLWNTQSQEIVQRIREKTDRDVFEALQSSSDPTWPASVAETYDSQRIQLMIVMQQVTSSLKDNETLRGKGMGIDSSRVKETADMKANKKLGFVEDQDGSKLPVVIEYLEYAELYINESETLIKRVDGLASTLARLSGLTPSLPLLACVGFCHIPENRAFGILFRVPEQAMPEYESQNKAMPQTIALSDLINRTKSRRDRPSLDAVFLLAWKLANIVSTIHASSWLHMNLSSSNVLFFPDKQGHLANSITSPYLTGFNHSRESHESAFTVGPSLDPEEEDYQHPEYDSSKGSSVSKFKKEFDYYSLGILLLEIGRWTTLRHLLKGRRTQSPEGIRDYILEEKVPELASYMGRPYHDAVRSCLDGTVGDSLDAFERLVVAPMGRCRALHS
ncbi:kinase-like domain-containing protein [Rostrohypoxylon terebratum]|nr:kinase-like domain-containing protein [Rostrohypoxylon terebratum]